MEPDECMALLRQLPSCLFFKRLGDADFSVSNALARQFGETSASEFSSHTLRFYDPTTKDELLGSSHPFAIAEETLHLCQWVRMQKGTRGIQFFLESSIVTLADDKWVVINARAVQNNLFIAPEASSPVGKHITFNGLLSTFSAKLISAADTEIEKIIDDVLGAFGQFCDLDRCYLFEFFDNKMFARNTHEWVAAGVTGYIDSLQRVSMETMPYLNRKIKKEGLFVVNNVDYLPSEAKEEKAEFEHENICSILCAAVRLNGEIYGFIGCDITGSPYTWREHDIAYLKRIAELLGNSLQNTHNKNALQHTQLQLLDANRKLAELANIDGLTGIANRRLFDETLQRDIEKMVSIKKELSLLLIDVDLFKDYNDLYGQVAGDTVLKRVAHVVTTTCIGNDDLVARYGGEEFVVVMPFTTERSAIAIAERIRQNILNESIFFEGSAFESQLTVSIGVTTVNPGPSEISPNQIIDQADKALYLAKSLGRNKVSVWDNSNKAQTVKT